MEQLLTQRALSSHSYLPHYPPHPHDDIGAWVIVGEMREERVLAMMSIRMDEEEES